MKIRGWNFTNSKYADDTSLKMQRVINVDKMENTSRLNLIAKNQMFKKRWFF